MAHSPLVVQFTLLAVMAINLTLLRSFYLVVDAGGISKASRTGYASQAGLSKAVRELENQLGVQLLERSTHGSVPTKAGHELFEFARAIFSLEERAENAIKSYKGIAGTTLNIGAGSTIAAYVLPPVLKTFGEKFPSVSVALSRANARHIETALWNYEFDVALIAGPPQDAELERVVFGEDELVCVVAPDHPLAKRELSFVSDLKQFDWVMREEGATAREAVLAALRPYGWEPKSRLQVNGCEAHKQAVAAGLGMGFISRLAVADQVALGRLCIVPVAELEVRTVFYLIRLPNRPVSPAAKAFETVLLKRDGARM